PGAIPLPDLMRRNCRPCREPWGGTGVAPAPSPGVASPALVAAARTDLHNHRPSRAISLSILFRSWQKPAIAGVAKLVDARDLKSLGLGHAGSIPAARTKLAWPSWWTASGRAVRGSPPTVLAYLAAVIVR